MILVCIKIKRYVSSTFEFFLILEKVCQADLDKDSNLIPIIVGACLATLIVVVLVAYLIGRGRTRTGYQSV
jgi:predicted permease